MDDRIHEDVFVLDKGITLRVVTRTRLDVAECAIECEVLEIEAFDDEGRHYSMKELTEETES